MGSTRRFLPYACALTAFFLVIWRILRLWAAHLSLNQPIPLHMRWERLYNYTVLISNYFTEGFVRRGISGTLFYLIKIESVAGRLAIFHGLSALALLSLLFVILRRLAKSPTHHWVWLSVVLVLSPPLFMAWARDVARGDMLAEAFIVGALIACLGQRYLVAATILFLASQVHENGLIYGVPLCISAGYLDFKAGKLSTGKAVSALTLLSVLTAAALVAQRLFGMSPPEMAHDMLIHSAPPNPDVYSDPTTFRDLAIYLTVGGVRTIKSSACVLFQSKAAYLYIFSIYFVLFLYGLVLPAFSRLRIGLLLFVGVLPMTLVTVLAIDYGRWLSFAVLNWWLVNAVLELKGVDPLATDGWPPRVSIAAAVAVLAMGPGEITAANLTFSKLAEGTWHGNPKGNRFDWCDPTWRSVFDPSGMRPS